MLVGEAAHVAAATAAASLVPHQRLVPVASTLLGLLASLGEVGVAGVGPLSVDGHDGELGVPAPQTAVRIVAGDAQVARATAVGEVSLGAEVGETVAEVVGRDDGVEHLSRGAWLRGDEQRQQHHQPQRARRQPPPHPTATIGKHSAVSWTLG